MKNLQGKRYNYKNSILSTEFQCFRQFFTDALPVVSTGASIQMMHSIFTSGMLSDARQDIWLTSLGFATQPTLQMIKSASVSPITKILT